MQKITHKKIFQYIGESAIAIVVFSLFLFLMPESNKDLSYSQKTAELEFVFHQSAEDWDAIFEEYELDDILSGELKDEVVAWLDEETAEEEPKIITRRSCDVPWMNQQIEHGEYVLAYEQRVDVPTICNVERRLCIDGTLLGSFTQRACSEDIIYEYTAVPVVSYHTQQPGELIQPSEPPYQNATFSINGKRYETIAPTSSRNNTINDPRQEESTRPLVETEGHDCTTPRGETVNNRQFVKAYKTAFGFVNAPCEVELRYCLEGELDGDFEYKYCEHTEMTREDYMLWSKDETTSYQEDSILNILNSLK